MAGANSLHFTQPRELMRKIPHYMSWKAIFNTVVCFGKKIRLTHGAVTIVTVLWVHKESLFTVIFRDCPAKQQLTQIDSLKVKRNFTYRRSLFFRFKFPLEQRQIKATRKREEGRRLHRWRDMGTNRNHQRFQLMRDAMTPEKPHMCYTQS